MSYRNYHKDKYEREDRGGRERYDREERGGRERYNEDPRRMYRNYRDNVDTRDARHLRDRRNYEADIHRPSYRHEQIQPPRRIEPLRNRRHDAIPTKDAMDKLLEEYMKK